MDQVQRLIETYRCLPSPVDAEGSSRFAIITELGRHVGDPRVVDLYVSVIADPQEYDLARIECIKVLGLRPPDAHADRQRVGRAIAQTLWPDEDYLVRQYAAMSLGAYAEDDDVFEALATALTHDDDIDVRHNALESIREAGPDDRGLALLRRMVDDPELGSAAKHTLQDWAAGVGDGTRADRPGR
ncbi:HEAT repeat domain-containing protein [Rugosimonospora africana]|uniref:HEAT repeat domain-containing protein n=1 Tax=Rugosimonospora africana TaxID=556532 RepID=A0A8J3QWT9_9ACTN|nr:HEAT repeat domain-containing protein [Rugosimonospora africana]GIH17225.1 hypothetical protein Raf01_53970 [Rugosimonospora africana]